MVHQHCLLQLHVALCRPYCLTVPATGSDNAWTLLGTSALFLRLWPAVMMDVIKRVSPQPTGVQGDRHD